MLETNELNQMAMIMNDITIAITLEKRKKVFGWFKLDEIMTFTLLVLLKVTL